jgi:hypothetical protein
VFSLISLAGYILKLIRIRGLLATSGYQMTLSFSKVRELLFFQPSPFFHRLLDVCGKLEGESIVQASIQGAPNLWCLEEPPLLPASPQADSPSRNTPPPITTASTTDSTADGPFQDWREPIRQGLISPHANIRIRALSPNDTSPGTPASPSAIPPGVSSGCDDRSFSVLGIPAQSSVHHTHRSVRHTVTSQRSPLSKEFQRRTAPLSQTTHIPSRQPPIASLSPKDQATPTPVLENSITPTPRDISQRRPQDHALTGEVFLQQHDVRSSIHLTVTVASPPGETSPRILQIGDGAAKVCRNNPGQADIRSSEQKGAARLVPHPDSTSALLTQGLIGRVQKTAAWQFWSQICNQAFQK